MKTFVRIFSCICLFSFLFILILHIFLTKREVSNYRVFYGPRKFKDYSRTEIRTPQSPNEAGCQKWVVITAAQSPSQVILEYKKLIDEDKSDWCCVVVLLTNKNVEEEYSNLKSTKFIILNGEDQLFLTNPNTGFLSLQDIADNSLAKRKIGYLYAIKHGALIIYNAHENYNLEGKIPSTEIARDYVLVSSQDHVCDPYFYYYSNISDSQRISSLPMGYWGLPPNYQYVNIVGDNCNTNDIRNPSVIQLLVNQDTPNAKYFNIRSDTSNHLVLDKGLLYYEVCRENGNSYTSAWSISFMRVRTA